MLRQTDESNSSLISQMAAARRLTDSLFQRVPPALLYERPIAERHRVAFYVGHLEAFDANLLRLLSRSPRDQQLRGLFAFGIDPVGGALPSDGIHDWPSMPDIRDFVADTRARLDRWLMSSPPTEIGGVSLTTLLHTAIEHRWMHAETLAYLFNRLPLERPVRAGVVARPGGMDESMVSVPSGLTVLGRSRDEGFGWDNEYGRVLQNVPAFQIDRYMVSNAQFERFLEAGGYQDPRWWSHADWQWRQAQEISHPAAWSGQQGQWFVVSRDDRVPFQGDWPVYVSHAEASAYARWCGKSLPSEAQWQRAAYGDADAADRPYPWGQQNPGTEHGHFDFAGWDPMPVNAHPSGASPFGVEGLLGNGWEWTASEFAPFEGFEAFSFYRGYSADFFDGRHFVQKGGSPHTARALLRRSFRNWFQPHYPYAFAGFRCVRPA